MLRAATLGFLPAFGILALASATLAQPDLVHRETLQSRDAPAPGFRTELVRVQVGKGGLVARHTHPGLEIGYVEDGQALVKVQGQPDRALTRGGSFAVMAGTPHSLQNTGPGALTMLSTYVVDKSKPLATPAP